MSYEGVIHQDKKKLETKQDIPPGVAKISTGGLSLFFFFFEVFILVECLVPNLCLILELKRTYR